MTREEEAILSETDGLTIEARMREAGQNSMADWLVAQVELFAKRKADA